MIETCSISRQRPGRCCSVVEHLEDERKPLARYAALMEHTDEEPVRVIEHLLCVNCSVEARAGTLWLQDQGTVLLLGMKDYHPRPGYAPSLVDKDG